MFVSCPAIDGENGDLKKVSGNHMTAKPCGGWEEDGTLVVDANYYYWWCARRFRDLYPCRITDVRWISSVQNVTRSVSSCRARSFWCHLKFSITWTTKLWPVDTSAQSEHKFQHSASQPVSLFIVCFIRASSLECQSFM